MVLLARISSKVHSTIHPSQRKRAPCGAASVVFNKSGLGQPYMVLLLFGLHFACVALLLTLFYEEVALNKALEGEIVTMLYSLCSLHLWCLSMISFTCAKSFFIAQDDCPDIPGQPRVVTSVLVVKHTIRIITNIPIDTTLRINTDLSITVNNAPTELDVITTYYSRSTASQTYAGYATSSLAHWILSDFPTARSLLE